MDMPGHANIRGKEFTDRAAKKALNCDVESDLIPPLRSETNSSHIKAKWQHEWDKSINKLHNIQPSVGKPPQIHMGGRQHQVVPPTPTHHTLLLVHGRYNMHIPSLGQHDAHADPIRIQAGA